MSGNDRSVREDTKTSRRNTWNDSINRLKGPVKLVGGIIAILVVFMSFANWLMDQKIEALRVELEALRTQMNASNEGTESKTTTLDVDIGENNRRISDTGERLARMESTLTGTTGRLDRLHSQVTKNTEAVLKAAGTPDVKVGGTPD